VADLEGSFEERRVSRVAGRAEALDERVAKRSHTPAGTLRLTCPLRRVSHRFSAGLAAVIAPGSTRKSPSGSPEGLPQEQEQVGDQAAHWANGKSGLWIGPIVGQDRVGTTIEDAASRIL
jgi:hypothetical protein